MIVNAHAHIGDTRVFDVENFEDDLIRAMDINGIDVSLVMPSTGGQDYTRVHDRIAALAAKFPGRIFGIVNQTAHQPRESFYREAERCVRQMGFVGIKLHPLADAVTPLSSDGRMVFEVAEALGVPAMVHTGTGAPWALPALGILPAQEHPDLKIVLAHSGMGVFTAEAYVAAKVCPNIYLETSWCLAHDVRWLVKELGANRVMMAADLIPNMPVELAKYRGLGLEPAELDMCLAGTAIYVFKLPIAYPS